MSLLVRSINAGCLDIVKLVYFGCTIFLQFLREGDQSSEMNGTCRDQCLLLSTLPLFQLRPTVFPPLHTTLTQFLDELVCRAICGEVQHQRHLLHEHRSAERARRRPYLQHVSHKSLQEYDKTSAHVLRDPVPCTLAAYTVATREHHMCTCTTQSTSIGSPVGNLRTKTPTTPRNICGHDIIEEHGQMRVEHQGHSHRT